MQDYQDSTKKLKERFTADYSASAEVATVLKQSTAIDTFMRAQPSSMKGRSEWDHQVANLANLAKAYTGAFPLAEGAAIRRMNDKEAAGVAAAIATAADRFKSDIDKDAKLAKPDKDAAKKDVELLVKQANALKSRTSDGQPATGELRQVTEQIAKIQAFVSAILPRSWETGRRCRPRPASCSRRSARRRRRRGRGRGDPELVVQAARQRVHRRINKMLVGDE